MAISKADPMRIVVNHLTRMQPGFICVAGIDMETKQQVRPVVAAHRRMQSFLLASKGGPFDISALVEIGETKPVPDPPHVEDHEFDWMRARRLKYIEPERYLKMLVYVLRENLADVFGAAPELIASGSCYLPEGSGVRSLGCIRPRGACRLQLVEREGKPPAIRMSFVDRGARVNLSVTDIRLCSSDFCTPDPCAVQRVADRLEAGASCILSVGLTRPYPRVDGERPERWLQVNNIHFEENPGWRLCPE
jgi:hypothetical protein